MKIDFSRHFSAGHLPAQSAQDLLPAAQEIIAPNTLMLQLMFRRT